MKSRGMSALLLAVLCAVPAAAERAGSGTNWLLNPGAETQPVTALGWRSISGDWSTVNPHPTELVGQAFHGAGETSRAELVQEVSLATLASWLTGGGKKARLRGYLLTQDESERSQLALEVLGAGGSVLSRTSTDPDRSRDTWTLVTLTVDLPATAAMIRLRLVSVDEYGSADASYFDELEITLLDADGADAFPVRDAADMSVPVTRIPEGYYGYTTTSGEVDASDPFENGVNFDTYAFAAAAGHRIELSIWGTEDGLKLISPDGEVLAEHEVYLDVVIPTAGTYTVQVTARPERRGSYRLDLWAPGRTITGALDPVQDARRITPDGYLYDEVRVELEAGYWVFDLEQSFQGQLILRDRRRADVETTPDSIDGKLRQQARIDESGTFYLMIIGGDDPAGGPWVLTQTYRGT